MIQDRDDELEKYRDEVSKLQNALRMKKSTTQMQISQLEQIRSNSETKYKTKCRDLIEQREQFERQVSNLQQTLKKSEFSRLDLGTELDHVRQSNLQLEEDLHGKDRELAKKEQEF